MSAVLTVLLWTAGVLLLALATMLLMPVRLSGWATTSPRLAYRLDARFFGAWAPRIPLLDSARPCREAARLRQPPAAQPAGARRPRARRSGVGGVNGARMFAALPRLLGEMVGSVRWEAFHLDAEFGLGDPADTGQVYGCLMPLQFGAPWPPGVRIALRPNFERACLDGEVGATLRLRAASLLPPAARFVWRAFGPRP